MSLVEGVTVDAGQVLGTHIGEQTMSDVAVAVDDVTGFRLVSWFEAVTDALFEGYRARGLPSRAAAIIARSERDQQPLWCQGAAFATRGTLVNWIALQ